jgi:hypothetical protein
VKSWACRPKTCRSECVYNGMVASMTTIGEPSQTLNT